MATPSLATGARQLAQSSAASSAPVAARPLRTRAHRPAAMATWRRMRSATTATPSMMMGAAAPARRKAGTTALRQPAIDPHAGQSAETGTGLVWRDATMATPSLATGARHVRARLGLQEQMGVLARAVRPASTRKAPAMASARTAERASIHLKRQLLVLACAKTAQKDRTSPPQAGPRFQTALHATQVNIRITSV